MPFFVISKIVINLLCPKKILMNKLTLYLFLLISVTTFSQKEEGKEASENLTIRIDSSETKWQLGGDAGIFATQVSFINWSAGGVSSISGIINGSIFTNYRENKQSWETDFTAEWGMIKNQGEQIKKNRDVFELNSKYGYQVDKKGQIFLGSLLKFRSQITKGYNEGDSVYTTNFMAPARLVLAVGVNWKPKEYFSLFFSPAAGKFTFVLDEGIDGTSFGLIRGKKMRKEFGAYLKANFQKELFKNLLIKSTLTLFNNFLDNSSDTIYVNNIQTIKYNRANIDVDWIVGADFVFNEWLTVNISTQLIYDHDVKIGLTEKDGRTPILNNDGSQKTGSRTQFAESFSIGLKYRFKPKDRELK